MFKLPKQEYTPEFKEGAVQRVLSGGQGISAVAKDLVRSPSKIGHPRKRR